MSDKKLTIAQLKKIIKEITDLNDPRLQEYKDDSRIGVQRLVERQIRLIINQQKELIALKERFVYEEEIYRNNPDALIAGVDEVGRGPLAGPVVACAIILPRDVNNLVGVKDSKTLSHKKRLEFKERIIETAITYSIAEASVEEIDKLNILEATKLAMKRAVLGLKYTPDHVLIDALELDIDINQTKIIKGDDRSLSVAAASILAKEYRDELMVKLSTEYPEFSFDSNMGYGTKEHLDALNKYGRTDQHRMSFAPVASINKEYFKK